MRTSPFTDSQDTVIRALMLEWHRALNSGLSHNSRMRTKKALAARCFASPELEVLGDQLSRNEWYERTVRRFTNYQNQVWRVTGNTAPNTLPIKIPTTLNPLLPTLKTARQLFAATQEDTINAKMCGPDGVPYQSTLKALWDALPAKDRSHWEAWAAAQAGNITQNQANFVDHLTLYAHNFCQNGRLGPPEIVIFYGVRDPTTNELISGSIHGHNIHNTQRFGGDDLEEDHLAPWEEWCNKIIPSYTIPEVSMTLAATVHAMLPDPKDKNMGAMDGHGNLAAMTVLSPRKPPTPPRRKRGPMPDNKPSGRRRDQHHLREGEIPADAQRLKTAFELHIRMLMGVYEMNALPILPSVATVKRFLEHYADADDVLAAATADLVDEFVDITADAPTVSSRAREIHKAATHVQSHIAKSIALLDTSSIGVAISMYNQVGLAFFRPDLIGGTVDDSYNLVHEIVAIRTFQVLLRLGTYNRQAPNTRRLDDISFLRKLYRSIVWSYYREKILTEQRNPGALEARQTANGIYKRREQLTTARSKFLKDRGFSEEVQGLCGTPECNSDDDLIHVGGAEIYVRMSKEYRDSSLTHLIRNFIDPQRLAHVGLATKRRSRTIQAVERERHEHPAGPISSPYSRRLPPNCPIDWFEPDKFNELPASIRYHYPHAPVAMPLPESRNEVDWKDMNPRSETFMSKYGDAVRNQYLFPTSREVRRLRKRRGTRKDRDRKTFLGSDYSNDSNDSGDDDEDDDDDDDDDDDNYPPAPEGPSQPPFGSFNPAGAPRPPPPGPFGSFNPAPSSHSQPPPRPQQTQPTPSSSSHAGPSSRPMQPPPRPQTQPASSPATANSQSAGSILELTHQPILPSNPSSSTTTHPASVRKLARSIIWSSAAARSTILELACRIIGPSPTACCSATGIV
ncbi:hypothetical protein C8F01DRAFT_1292721 [Mycena amicta]|nr:hypothetical protein C8F01DRAFT_1292721 [Mycena amicta]